MHKLGLKLWSINTDFYYVEAQKLYDKNVYDYIELYVVPDTVEYLPKWKKLNIPFIIHCPHFAHGFNLAKAEKKSSNKKIFEQVQKYADELNVPYIVVHGGIDGDVKETAQQMALLNDARALIENKPYVALPNRMGGNFCRGYNPEEIKLIKDTSKCGFCLDFGHAICAANSLKINVYDYIESFLHLEPNMFHLTDISDITSVYDAHPHLGMGQLDVLRVLKMIPDGKHITLETNKNSKENIDDFIGDCSYIRQLEKKNMLKIRLAEESDMKRVFELSNDPVVRENSINKDKIEWESHIQWFEKRILNKTEPFYIVEDEGGKFLAQVRFDKNEGQNVISVSICENYRGHGLGAEVISVCSEKYAQKPIFAYIQKTNTASKKAFIKSGYRLISEKNINNTDYEIYILD